mmetsp:Transcript_140260/g.257544  ORF Transcript_140260/g.257544 Transcript_140260/m.257544 type:complete len:85 (-) Transcript_140260:808-1062(-)
MWMDKHGHGHVQRLKVGIPRRKVLVIQTFMSTGHCQPTVITVIWAVPCAHGSLTNPFGTINLKSMYETQNTRKPMCNSQHHYQQ